MRLHGTLQRYILELYGPSGLRCNTGYASRSKEHWTERNSLTSHPWLPTNFTIYHHHHVKSTLMVLHCVLQYHSMVDLETPSGSMQGCFHCVTLDGQGLPNEPLDARIRPFKLISPESASD
jgi:hypothetical protein